MTVRVVEGKKPYTGGKAIEITDDKVINLRLREENNLIIYDEGDDEIYVDLQLPDGIKPLDAFPVGITTGRVLVADDWDKTGTIICAKTTSGDNIKLLYADDGTLYIDNGTGIFKQVYFKADVDLIISAIQTQIDALSGLGRFLSLWDGETGEPISFPLSTPYTYHTGDWYMINVVDNTTNYRPKGSVWVDDDPSETREVETEATEIGDVYIYDGSTWLLQKNGGGGGSAVLFSQLLGSPYDNTNLATALNSKQGTLTAGANITIDQNNEISATDTTYTAGAGISIDVNNEISNTGVLSSNNTYDNMIHLSQADYDALVTKDPDTFYSTPNQAEPNDLNTKTFELTGTTGQTNLDTAQDIYNWYSIGNNPLILYNNYIYVIANATASALIFRGGLSQENQNSSTFIKQDVIQINFSSNTVTSIATDVYVAGGSFLRLGQNYNTPYTPINDGDPTSKKYVDEHGAVIPVYYLNGGFSSNITFNVAVAGEYRIYVSGYHGNTIDRTLTLTVDNVTAGTYTSNLIEHYFAHMNFTATAGSTVVLTVSSTSNFSVTEVYVEKINVQSGYLTATVN